MQRSLEEILPRDLLQGACTDILPRGLLQRSCQENSFSYVQSGGMGVVLAVFRVVV